MGRWRMKLEVPKAEVAEMLPLARLLSRSTDPAVLSRSKVAGMALLMQVVEGMETPCNDGGFHLEKIFIQKDNATIHADGTLLGPKTNLHFAVLNFPVSLVPTVVQIIESTATDVVHSLRQLLAPIKGILHMEGDLRGSLTEPECDVQIRLLDGAIGGIDLERAEVVASLTSTSRFLFNAKFEPIIQNGHVLIQGSIPVTFVQNNKLQQELELGKSGGTWVPDWVKEKNRGTTDDACNKKASRDRNEEALSPYANWLHGNADVVLEVRGTVDQPLLNGYASFHRASISSPVFRKPLTNFGGTVHMKSNRLSITSLESRLSRKGKLLVKGNLPLRTSEAAPDDKIELKCEVLEVQAKNFKVAFLTFGTRDLSYILFMGV
ncbi:hypothetical protein SESBI_14614 [Sesbania bispinosa]|nr:hypothetical protein SESBI_14614 [Sesbania bispinosa]